MKIFEKNISLIKTSIEIMTDLFSLSSLLDPAAASRFLDFVDQTVSGHAELEFLQGDLPVRVEVRGSDPLVNFVLEYSRPETLLA